MRIKDKVVIVTGAGRGIGRRICEVMAKEGAVTVVSDTDLDLAEETTEYIKSTFRIKTLAVKADVSKVEEVRTMVETVIQKFGTIDILVNNAGIVRPIKPIEEVTMEQWRKVIDINLLGVVNCCNAVIPTMKEKRYGKIISISSVGGQVGGIATEVTYPVTKAGIISFTKSLAKYLAKYGVNVNCVAPGTIRTNMTDILNYSKEMLETIPLGRIGITDDIAYAALYLASDESSYVTGATIDVNGGINMR